MRALPGGFEYPGVVTPLHPRAQAVSPASESGSLQVFLAPLGYFAPKTIGYRGKPSAGLAPASPGGVQEKRPLSLPLHIAGPLSAYGVPADRAMLQRAIPHLPGLTEVPGGVRP